MVAHAEMTIRSLSNHDSEGDENVNNLYILVGKQAGLHDLSGFFLYFIIVHFAAFPCQLTTLNYLFWSCMGDVTWLENLFSFSSQRGDGNFFPA